MHVLSLIGAVTLLAATSVGAQQVRAVRPAASTAPSANARAAQAAPNPAGLRSPNPAGLTAGSGAAVSGDPVAAGNAGTIARGTSGAPGSTSGTIAPTTGSSGPVANSTGTGTGPLGSSSDVAGDNVGTNVLGAGAAGTTARGPSQSVPLGSGGNPVEVARAFITADANADGELTRNEAARLGLAFEEMDRDFDGVITRAEYGDGRR